MNLSDLKALALLSTATDTPSTLLIYCGCAAVANVGQERPEEKRLGAQARSLLQARRDIFRGHWTKAEARLAGCRPSVAMLRGDRSFLLGMIAYRRDNDRRSADRNFVRASEIFKDAKLSYRQIRSDINRFILRRDLGEYVGGTLYALEQESVREGFFDMAASICRGRALERCVSGDFERALAPCRRSEKYYALDGCAEDQAVSQALRSVILFQLGRKRMARLNRQKIQLNTGQRLEIYFAILDALDRDEVPVLDKNHPLASTPWKKSQHPRPPRPNSCYGKILRILQKGPADKHVIMQAIWGEEAAGDIYENRLRVALSTLRRKQNVKVDFDGNAYFLAVDPTA